MRRVASVWFPTLPTDRIKQKSPDSAPLVTVARDGNRRVLVAVDALSAALGLRCGMKLAQAQALVPGLAIHDADPDGDAAALHRLAGWCLRYAPLAAADPPDGLWIDITGSTHLYGTEAALLRDLRQRLTRRGLRVRAAVADTPGLAHALARFGQETDDLPVEALRLPPDVIAGLRLMGFDRIGALMAANRAPLVRRFGAGLANRLDQLTGVCFEPIRPVIPVESIQARQTFVEPLLTAEAFRIVIARLAEQVCGDLERAGRGARQLDLLFERVDGSQQAIRIGTARANRDAAHLARMLTERLEQVDPGLGVEAVRLVVAAADRADFTQTTASLADDRRGADVAPVIDRLVNRLGPGRIYRLEAMDSDVPERSVRKAFPLLGRKADKRTRKTWPADLPRPVRLLDPPQPIKAMALLPDHPPVAFTWRRIRHRVRHADGPERIAGEWWKRDGEMCSIRDYFQVEDEGGRRFWLFRRGNGSDAQTGDMRWFLHGFF